jgi:hypothetical protein
MPGPKQPSRSAASGCSASVYRPIAAPSRLPVPDSAAATHRACGNAPSRDWSEGRPKNAAFLSLSGTSVTDPSIETTRSPQHNTPGARPPPSARHVLEQHPHRTGTQLAAPAGQRGDVRQPPLAAAPASTRPPGARRPASKSAPRRWQYSPSASLAITCPYPQFRPRNSHNASTKYTISRAGNSRRRCSRVPVTSMTSSTSSGGNALVSTPTEIRSGSQPSGESPSQPS